MSVDHATPEYPEHLNPFRRRRNTLTRSFRGIKNAIVRSFTGKEKEKPVLRPKQGNETATNRAVFSMPPSYNREPEIAFPRSRFSERVSKGPSSIRKKSISEDVGHNPFDELDENDPSKDNKKDDSTLLIPPKPAIRSKHKRRKKQAPIPPGSVGGSVSGSKWSLASTESDMSSMGCYSETDVDYIDRSVGDTEDILNLTREIVKFAEDTNNNSISNDAIDEVVSIASKKNEDVAEEASSTEVDSENNQKVSSVIVTNENDTDTIVRHVGPPKIEDDVPKTELLKEETSNVNDNQDEDVEVVLRKHTLNEINDNSITIIEENVVEARVGENTYEMTETERRISVKGAIDFFEGASSSPTPKVRKNILTKEILLGSDGV